MSYWLLFGAILFAGWRTKTSLSLAAYFFAQGAYMAATELSLVLYGPTSRHYAITYAVFTGLILLAVLNLSLRPVFKRAYPWRAIAAALVLSVVLARSAFLGLDHPARYYDYIGITEGTTLLFAGLLLAGVSYWTEKPLLFLCLGLLWLGQCAFRIGFYMHVTELGWLEANWYVPAWIGIVGFTGIGFLAGLTRADLRAERRSDHVGTGR